MATLPAAPLPASAPTPTAATSCAVCWDAVDAASRVAAFCSPRCPALLCRDCVRTHINIAITDVFPGVLPKVRCPICLVAVNKARWRAFADDFMVEAFASLCRAACAFRAPCCDDAEYTHLPASIYEDEYHYAATVQPRALRLTPSAKARIPELRLLCRAFCNHRATSTDVVSRVEQLTGSNDDARDLLMDNVLERILDEERRATLLLSYHYKYKLVETRCCRAAVCFNCKREWDWNDGIHFNALTCEENDPIAADGIVECPGCHITVVKVEGCESVVCPCGERFEIKTEWTPGQ